MAMSNMSEISKRLSHELGWHVDRNTIFKKLREAGYLNYRNEPYFQYQKYFIAQQVVKGNDFVTRITLVKPKGIELIRKLME